MTTFDLNNLPQITKPRTLAWKNWAKFTKIGDEVKGFIVDVFYKKAIEGFQDGRGITLKQEDGTLINVSIKNIDFILKETDHLKLGDPMGAKFTSQGEKVLGKNQAKIFTYFGINLPENAANQTVKELYEADMKAGGVVEAVTEAPEVNTDEVPFT